MSEPELGQVYTSVGLRSGCSAHWMPPPSRMASVAQPDNSGLPTWRTGKPLQVPLQHFQRLKPGPAT